MAKMPGIESGLGSLEYAYRKAFLRSDASQAIFVIVLSNIASLTLIRSDYEQYGGTPTFTAFFIARISVFLISCISTYILARSPTPKWHDLAVTGYMVAGAVINLFINSITSPGYPAYIGVSIVLLNIYYFALFSPIFVRTTISCLFSIGIIFQAHQSLLESETRSVVIGMHILTNIIGVVVSSKLYNHRRDSFKAQIEEKELQKELDTLASTDPLTGIWNRRKFTTSAVELFEQAKETNHPLTIILIDIDNLKETNDTYGHLAGDEVICHCAKVMSMRIRDNDILGRLGGDEFGIVLPETQLSAGLIVGERIQFLGRETSINLNDFHIHISFSMGLAEMIPTDRSFDDLFARADKLLYAAKESGRDSIKFA
jgi:diguanylate cyclase (GGDEF)-like protein